MADGREERRSSSTRPNTRPVLTRTRRKAKVTDIPQRSATVQCLSPEHNDTEIKVKVHNLTEAAQQIEENIKPDASEWGVKKDTSLSVRKRRMSLTSRKPVRQNLNAPMLKPISKSLPMIRANSLPHITKQEENDQTGSEDGESTIGSSDCYTSGSSSCDEKPILGCPSSEEGDSLDDDSDTSGSSSSKEKEKGAEQAEEEVEKEEETKNKKVSPKMKKKEKKEQKSSTKKTEAKEVQPTKSIVTITNISKPHPPPYPPPHIRKILETGELASRVDKRSDNRNSDVSGSGDGKTSDKASDADSKVEQTEAGVDGTSTLGILVSAN